EAAARALESLGARIRIVDHVFDDPTDIFQKLWYSGAALAVAAIPETRRALMDPALLRMVDAGERIPHMAYLQATLERSRLGIRMNRFHEQFDLLLTPTMPLTAFDAGVQVADASRQRDWIDWSPFTHPFNMTHQPAASMPCGFTTAGLPVAIQIVGKVYADALVLRAARAFESIRPIELPSAAREPLRDP